MRKKEIIEIINIIRKIGHHIKISQSSEGIVYDFSQYPKVTTEQDSAHCTDAKLNAAEIKGVQSLFDLFHAEKEGNMFFEPVWETGHDFDFYRSQFNKLMLINISDVVQQFRSVGQWFKIGYDVGNHCNADENTWDVRVFDFSLFPKIEISTEIMERKEIEEMTINNQEICDFLRESLFLLEISEKEKIMFLKR